MLSKELPGYEHRNQQLEMTDIVSEAMANGQHAVVEAPTGVGKSLAYLVPAALHAMRNKRKVVISTGTIALQEQLIGKDIPTLQKVLPGLKAVLVKGRQNYISIRRLSHAISGQQALFEAREQAKEMQDIAQWVDKTEVGDRTQRYGGRWYRTPTIASAAAVPATIHVFFIRRARKSKTPISSSSITTSISVTLPCAMTMPPFYRRTMWWCLTKRTAWKMSPPTTWASALPMRRYVGF
jgi:hypothetical protein